MAGLIDKAREMLKGGKTDRKESDAIGELEEFRQSGESAKLKYKADYRNIASYYSGDKAYIFDQWRKMEGWEPWMAEFHVNILAVGIEELLSNIIPQWPRPMTVPFRSEYKDVADGADSLIMSVLLRGGYYAALADGCQNLGLYNLMFLMPTINTLDNYPERKIVIESIHPHNVLISKGSDSLEKAGEVLVKRRIHKAVLKGLYPEQAKQLEALAGSGAGDSGGTHGSTLRDGSYNGNDGDDPNNVTLEYFWQRDYTQIKTTAKVTKEQYEQENRDFFTLFSGQKTGIQDSFTIYDDHAMHYQSHQVMIDYLTKLLGANSQNYLGMMALQHFTDHNEKHRAALEQGIKGGAKLKYTYGKHFTMLAGQQVVLYSGSDPYGVFGIRDIPVFDFRLVGSGGEDYWCPHLGRRLVDLNAERNRVINNASDIMTAHGKPQGYVQAGSIPADQLDNKVNRMYHVKTGTTILPTVIKPPGLPGGIEWQLNRIDKDTQRTLGLFESFRGELPAKLSGIALEELNTQSSKIIDVKLDLQRHPIARFGDALLKMALGIFSGEEQAVVSGEYGLPEVKAADIDAIKRIEYQIVAVPGKKDLGPAEQKMNAFSVFMEKFGPMIMQFKPGMMLKLMYEIGKGSLPEFEMMKEDFEELQQMVEQQQNAAGMGMPPDEPPQMQ